MKDATTVENTPQVGSDNSFAQQAQNQWGSLSSQFMAHISLCDKTGKRISGSSRVIGVALDGDMVTESQYSSPFENSNPETRLPTLMGMLQSGDWVAGMDKALGGLGFVGEVIQKTTEGAQDQLKALEGRSNFTKINSTQIYVASSSLRINMVVFFQAWADAKKEVEDQIQLLQEWSLPEKLEEDSILVNLAENMSLDSLFPSLVPPYVSLTYGRKRYAPLILESVSAPLVTPLDPQGNRIVLETNISLLSRQAWDKANIQNLYRNTH